MNFAAITRRIRRCESEVPAQLVLEYAIKEAIEAEREACAQLCEGEPRSGRQGAARNGPAGAGAWYEGSPMHRVTSAIAAAIRQRGAA
jgi:hypothetical protein